MEFSISPRTLLKQAKNIFPPRQFRKIQNNVTKLQSENISNFSQPRDTQWHLTTMKKIIETNTEITREHMTPELRLRLLTPRCRLYSAPVIDDFDDATDDFSTVENLEKRIFRDPFWSIYWPGGQAITRFVMDGGTELLNRSKIGTSFLDLGCGCGASAIAAKIIGAERVVANDTDEVACVATNMNAKLNNVDIETTSKNLLTNLDDPWESSWDVILVGDLLYDDKTSGILIPWLERAALRNGSRIYLGDPGRHGLTEALRNRMELLKTYSLPGNVRRENHGYDVANVWQLKIRS